MKINIVIDVDVRESGFSNEDEIKDNIVDFTRDLLNNGAENQGIGYTLCEVDYNNCYQVVKDKIFNKCSSFNPCVYTRVYIKKMLLNEETFYETILNIKDNINEFNIIIDEPLEKNFHNDMYKFILYNLIKYVSDNDVQFISVNDLYNILNNEDFYDYVLVEFNNCIDYLEWNIEVLKSEIDSLTILFQALTGIIYKASSEN